MSTRCNPLQSSVYPLWHRMLRATWQHETGLIM